tara:strand:+ start:1563 stop:2627 length:1065 start_codon:yes stop_codon:yes gene_type:complete
MAMNVNTVYTTVLSILNKEQRGYLTPDEFNKIATQVQLEEFEKFFEDYNQYLRMPKTDEEFASRVDHIREEFQIFEKTENASAHVGNVYTQPTTLHRFGSATYAKANGQPAIEIVSSREYREQVLSPLLQPSMNFPIAKYQENKLTVFPPLTPSSHSDVSFNYIRKPEDVRWGYVIGSLGQYIYDDTVFSDSKLAISSLAGSINFNSSSATAGAYPLTQGAAGTGSNTFQTSGAGTGAKLSVVISGTGIQTLTAANTVISVTLQGTGYAVGDTLTIATNSFILGSPSADIIITLTSANLMSGTGQGSKQFEISDSLQTNLTLGVLKYAGVIIKDTQVIQAASGLQQLDEQNSKK